MWTKSSFKYGDERLVNDIQVTIYLINNLEPMYQELLLKWIVQLKSLAWKSLSIVYNDLPLLDNASKVFSQGGLLNGQYCNFSKTVSCRILLHSI